MIKTITTDYPIFQTTRLHIKPITLDEQQRIHYQASSNTNSYQPLGGHYLIHDTQDYITTMLHQQDKLYIWGIYLRQTDTLIGSIHLSDINVIHRNAQISFLLAEDYWGQGFTTEAADCVVDFAFEHLNLHKLLAKCFIEHYPTHRVLQKLHMNIEGIAKQHFYLDGIFHDVTLYARFNDKIV